MELSNLEGAHGRVGRCDDALVGTTTASMAAWDGSSEKNMGSKKHTPRRSVRIQGQPGSETKYSSEARWSKYAVSRRWRWAECWCKLVGKAKSYERHQR